MRLGGGRTELAVCLTVLVLVLTSCVGPDTANDAAESATPTARIGTPTSTPTSSTDSPEAGVAARKPDAAAAKALRDRSLLIAYVVSGGGEEPGSETHTVAPDGTWTIITTDGTSTRGRLSATATKRLSEIVNAAGLPSLDLERLDGAETPDRPLFRFAIAATGVRVRWSDVRVSQVPK